jgi:hypothetical protein
VHERRSELVLERRERPGDARLRHPEQIGGRRERPLVVDRDEHPQLPKVKTHVNSVSIDADCISRCTNDDVA